MDRIKALAEQYQDGLITPGEFLTWITYAIEAEKDEEGLANWLATQIRTGTRED